MRAHKKEITTKIFRESKYVWSFGVQAIYREDMKEFDRKKKIGRVTTYTAFLVNRIIVKS